MKTIRWCAALAFVFGPATCGAARAADKLPGAVAKALEKADELDVYSLGGETTEKDGWHGARVLGQTTVKGETEQKALAAAVKKGVEEGDRGARCFVPRHGVRATHDGKTYDLLICFECGWLYVGFAQRIPAATKNKDLWRFPGLRIRTYDANRHSLGKALYVYTDESDKPTVLMISEGPQKALNKILTAARVPLAKPEK